jgi:hypothetical protein
MSTLSTKTLEISSNGKRLAVPGLHLQDRAVLVTGRWARQAVIHDEEWLLGKLIPDLNAFLAALRSSELRPDYFTFAQPFFEPVPRHPFRFVWDNIAAVPIISYSEWWDRRVSHDLRKDVKRAEKRGVQVRVLQFDDHLVQGIKALYDETPYRQGRRFWHYGKDLETVKRENSTYLERSTFIGAFCEEQLIGFIKMVRVDDVERMMQILARDDQQDKRPMNALIAKAVEVAAGRSASYLTYGKYTYDGRRSSSVALFKRRNGFEEILFPRYFIPFTAKGHCLVRTGLHLGVRRLIPEKVYEGMRHIRAKLIYRAEGGGGSDRTDSGTDAVSQSSLACGTGGIK